jgi:hypothetical protein
MTSSTSNTIDKASLHLLHLLAGTEVWVNVCWM